jgi:hypothetical protein
LAEQKYPQLSFPVSVEDACKKIGGVQVQEVKNAPYEKNPG